MRLTAMAMGIIVLTGSLALAMLAAGSSYAASGEEVITARQNYMKDEMERYWRPLAAYAKGGQGSLADVEKNALAIAKSTEKMAQHFPKDTGRGNFPDKMTAALPAIWKDWDGFNKAIKDLSGGSERLARLAREGDKDGVVAMIGTTGSYNRTNVGCGGCHEKFRGPRAAN